MKILLLVEHHHWDGAPEEYPQEMPNQFVDVEVVDHITAERMQKFCESYTEQTGWHIHILSMIRVDSVGPLPGDTQELSCPQCKRKTSHQFVREDASAGLLPNMFEYLWQCMECDHEHPPVAFDL